MGEGEGGLEGEVRSAAADTQVPGAAHHFAGFLSFSFFSHFLTLP